MPKRRPDDVYFPVPQDFNARQAEKSAVNNDVIKRIIQGAVVSAFGLKRPSDYDKKYGNYKRGRAVASNEQMETVIHLIESLKPQDAIEAALASQFAITYIRGLETSPQCSIPLDLFEFGHKVLEALQKYRSKGAQQISVNYNVNQGQVVNIKTTPKADPESVNVEGEVL